MINDSGQNYFIQANPTPGQGTFFADREVRLPSPITRIVLTARNSDTSQLFLHFTPLNKQNGFTVAGNEQWLPLWSSDRKYPVVVFKTPIQNFYLTGTGAPPDFTLLCTSQIADMSDESNGGATGTQNVAIVSPLDGADVATVDQVLKFAVFDQGTTLGPGESLVAIAALADDGSAEPLTVDNNGVMHSGVDTWGKVAVDAATTSPPVGNESAPVVRPVARKKQTLETSTPLAGGGVFTGPWHDSQESGANFVSVTAIANVNSAATTGCQLQESEDQVNVRPVASIGATTANRIFGFIRARYWRVVYTNGASPQASFSLYVTSSSQGPVGAAVGTPTDVFPIASPNSAGDTGDNTNVISTIPPSSGGAAALETAGWGYGGAFSGTTDAARRFWSKRRMPTVFKTAQATAAGNTAVWTPGANNKFRLQGFLIELTGNASLAVAGVLTIQFFDAAAAMPLAIDVFVPAAAGTLAGDAVREGFIYLGDFGILSAAANNVLNINLSAALATGNVRVIACGTEE